MVVDGKKLFANSRTMFGAWTSLGHPSITEIFARSGVDFVGIDLEHSTIDQEQAQRLIAASHSFGKVCLPRIASHNEEQIKRLLDSGADGIIVPQVSSLEQIERLVQWSKYPAMGERSYGVARAQAYGFDFEDYVSAWNERSVIIIQIESIRAVEAIDELLSHAQVDGAMIGPYDLSGSLGIPGKLSHPRVIEACNRVVEACRHYGKACGTQIVDPNEQSVRAVFDEGYTFAVLASDVFVLWKWSERMRELVCLLRQDRGP